MKKSIKIGNAGGYWGDDLKALKRQLESGILDYITADYLAEITMSILRKQQLKDPALGYVTDFINQVSETAMLIKRSGTRLIVNAGGINPLACGKAVIKELNEKNIQLKVIIVEGDNIIEDIDRFYPDEADFTNMETEEPFLDIRESLVSANVYLGVLPLLKALQLGADLIIAGRVTDTSISMAPIIHEFGWKLNDWDKLASGLVAGHIIECGAQATGGNYTDWRKVSMWKNMGYPVVEVFPSGDFMVTKIDGSGGLVNSDIIKEQLVYEMGDPGKYISPDVIADFRTIKIEDVAKNKVRIQGVKGYPATPFYKLSMAYEDGFTATSSIIIGGDEALAKGTKFAEIFWDRLPFPFEKKNTSFVGYDGCFHELAPDIEPNEILLRFSVYDNDFMKIQEFSKNIAPMILSGPPGVAVTGGRPRVQKVISYWPALISKKCITSVVKVLGPSGEIVSSFQLPSLTGFEEENPDIPESKTQISDDQPKENIFPGEKTVKIRDICLARSGDKGDMANIGVIARNKEIYSFINEHFTANYVKYLFRSVCKGKVIRYELDNLLALNFLLESSLDGGGTKSLMIDSQGKTFASALLNQTIQIPVSMYKYLNHD